MKKQGSQVDRARQAKVRSMHTRTQVDTSMKVRAGFSLIESVITLAVFSLVVLVAIDVFLLVGKNQSRFTVIQSVEGDVRFVLNQITREFRESEIDYEFYGLVTEIDIADDTGRHVLALRDRQGNSTVYRQSGSNESNPWDGGGAQLEACFESCHLNDAVWDRVTPREVDVVETRFYLSPAQSPWQQNGDGSHSSDKQPRLTFLYHARGEGEDGDQKDMRAQTTVTSRYYQR